MAVTSFERLWSKQNRHPGDRMALFTAVAAEFGTGRVLYPGSYVDVTASFVFADVVYVDTDARAKSFFSDRAALDELVEGNKRYPDPALVDFVRADYTSDLPLAEASFDLLVSLYAGFVSRACKRYLRTGGLLLANNSHGDASMASIDPDFQLVAAVNKRGGSYRATTRDLDSYLVPRQPIRITPELLEQRQRGVGYTRSPAAYVFRLRR